MKKIEEQISPSVFFLYILQLSNVHYYSFFVHCRLHAITHHRPITCIYIFHTWTCLHLQTYTSVTHDTHRYQPVSYAAADYNTDTVPGLEQSLRTSSGGSTPTTPVFGPWGEKLQTRDAIEAGTQEDLTVDVSQTKPMC